MSKLKTVVSKLSMKYISLVDALKKIKIYQVYPVSRQNRAETGIDVCSHFFQQQSFKRTELCGLSLLLSRRQAAQSIERGDNASRIRTSVE